MLTPATMAPVVPVAPIQLGCPLARKPPNRSNHRSRSGRAGPWQQPRKPLPYPRIAGDLTAEKSPSHAQQRLWPKVVRKRDYRPFVPMGIVTPLMWLPHHMGLRPFVVPASPLRVRSASRASGRHGLPRRSLVLISLLLAAITGATPAFADSTGGTFPTDSSGVSAPTAQNVTLSTLDVQGQLLFFRVTNTTTSQVEPFVTVTGTSTDGTPIEVRNVSLGQLLPNESNAAEIPLGASPQSLNVALTASPFTATAQWPLPEGQIQELRPGADAPPPPDPGSNSALIALFAIIGGLFLIIVLRIILIGGKARRRLRRAARIRAARLAAGVRAAASRALPPPRGQQPIGGGTGVRRWNPPTAETLVAPDAAQAPAIESIPEGSPAPAIVTQEVERQERSEPSFPPPSGQPVGSPTTPSRRSFPPPSGQQPIG